MREEINALNSLRLTRMIQEKFELAVKDVELLRDRPSNETLLQLYSLFKQSTEGDNLNPPPENPFDFVAKANDLIEYNGTAWTVVFAAADHQEDTTLTYQTNIYTGVQYKWDGIAWTKSFEGEYKEGAWRLRL